MLPRRLAYSLLLLLLTFSLSAQTTERKDSLVRLLGCDELQQVDEYGVQYRKALGHARFEHNSTLLVCDTALWNVNTNVINAFGNVQIIQNSTVLSSESLDYLIDQNLAQFRGSLVQLRDKDGNTLRTRDLDYNTKDSVAVFRGGGALRDKDGQVIESVEGSYFSKLSTFTFTNNVNMYTDSMFVKTDFLSYDTEANRATFGTGTNAWKDDNMLSSRAGLYERDLEKFTFTTDVHLLTEGQEAWADTLVYYRARNEVEMFGHAELLDTSRNVAAVAGYMQYIDSLSYVKMTRDPAVIMISEQDGKKDTVYVGADTLILRSIPKCDVDSVEFVRSEARLKELSVDPITEYRRKAAEAAKAAAEEARKKMEEEDPNARGSFDKGGAALAESRKPILPAPWDDDVIEYEPPRWCWTPPATESYSLPVAGLVKTPARPLAQNPDTLKSASLKSQADTLRTRSNTLRTPADTLRASADTLRPQLDTTAFQADSLGFAKDSLAMADSLSIAAKDSLDLTPKDSTKINFIYGINNVKVFRTDMQVACDSLAYTDLDSLIRLYRKPYVWNETKRQYTADSITVIVKNQSIERASLMSNAFIIVQEDSLSFDQIRATEMMAYFDSTGTLRRFDAMGGASGVFFIEENNSLATVNKFESKMMTAILKEGNIQDLNYFDAVKSDAYPVVQLKKDERILKGFDWQPEKRPKGPEDITEYKPRESQRSVYEQIPRAKFAETDIYFPGYMSSVYKMLATQDSLKRVRKAERKRLEELRKAEEARVADSLRVAADSLALRDSLARKDSLAFKDSLALRDSLAARKDSIALKDTLAVSADSASVKNPLDPAAARKAAKEESRRKRAEAREARWAELDARDEAKAKVKEEKALKRKRKKTLKTLKAMEKRRAKEDRMLERYRLRFEKQKARKEARAAKRSVR